MSYSAWVEPLTGADLTGVDGNSGRTYGLAHLGAIQAQFNVLVQGVPLHIDVDFSVANDTITFNVPVSNFMVITLNYLTTYAGTGGSSYTTAALVQYEVRASAAFSSSTTPSLETVNNWIDEESALLESMTDEVFSSVAATNILIDYDGCGILRVPIIPLISVQTLQYNENSHNEAASWVTLQEGNGYNYSVYADEGELEFISGTLATNKITPRAGKKRFKLSYTYGYSPVPSEIQRLVTLMVAKRVINSLISSQANSEGGDIQVGTIRVSDPSSFSVNYIKSLNNEIETSLANIGRKFKTFRLNRVYN